MSVVKKFCCLYIPVNHDKMSRTFVYAKTGKLCRVIEVLPDEDSYLSRVFTVQYEIIESCEELE